MRNKSERLITLAIRAGLKTSGDISRETGLAIGTVYRIVNLLKIEHGVSGLTELRLALNPPATPIKFPEFTSHDCVIIDASLDPRAAAELIMQVLGDAYSVRLAKALSQL